MQTYTPLEPVGWLLVLGGILLIFIGIFLSLRRSEDDPTTARTESRGIILLGPIPIVWGFGKRTWLISVIGFVAILLFFVFFVLL